MTVDVVRGDARKLDLPDASVDLVVTSPPYWSLRSYTDGGEHYADQIGAEATPAAYVDSLIDCTRDWMRVLKPSGSIWVNLGDKYAGAPSGPAGANSQTFDGRERAATWERRGRPAAHGVPQKSLVGLPWRYALRCIDELGLILRAEVIWSKPNGLPESVTDRVRRSHETWFHFTKSPRYYAAVDAIREPYEAPNATRSNPGDNPNRHDGGGNPRNAAESMHPLGKLPGSVWTIATQPLRVPVELGVDHFAAFPMEWPRRIIAGWSPSGICTVCGQGRRPVVERPGRTGHGNNPDGARRSTLRGGELEHRARMANPDRITGEMCGCTPYTDHPGTSGDRPAEHERSAALGNGVRDNPGGGYGNAVRTGPRREYHLDQWTPPPTRPAVVLDPFGGTGTTALVASVLGRHGISVDMSADYCRVAEWRTTDTKQRERAARGPAHTPTDLPKDAA